MGVAYCCGIKVFHNGCSERFDRVGYPSCGAPVDTVIPVHHHSFLIPQRLQQTSPAQPDLYHLNGYD